MAVTCEQWSNKVMKSGLKTVSLEFKFLEHSHCSQNSHCYKNGLTIVTEHHKMVADLRD